MPVNYNAPCRVTIFAEMPSGEIRTIWIPFTGYGSERHIKRWLNRGAVSVTVYVDSRSTGRNVQRVTGNSSIGHA
jgi:hypothetical protein